MLDHFAPRWLLAGGKHLQTMSSSDLARIPNPAQPVEGTETLDELFLL